MKPLNEIKKDIEEILKGCFDSKVGGFNITKAKRELTDYTTKSNREAVEGFAEYMYKGKTPDISVANVVLDDSYDLIESLVQTYLSQLNKENDYDNK